MAKTRGEVSVKAKFNPFYNIISEEEAKMLIDGWKPEPPKIDTRRRTPVRLMIREINRNGVITINFNQPLHRPPFLEDDVPKNDSNR